MNHLRREKKIQVIQGLCEGLSLRAASRLFGVHRTTIMQLLVRVGNRCEQIMAEQMRDLDIQRLEIDELWTFCGRKQLRLNDLQKRDPLLGDQYVFYAIDPVTKLVPAWEVGKRDGTTALDFMRRLNGTMNGNRPQISTDAFPPYPDVIETVFGTEVDYATIRKEYEAVPVGPGRYAPPRVSGVSKRIYMGSPNERHISTSRIERANLSMRTFQRRFTRLSLGFSRKMENLLAAVALHFAYYNFCWMHRSLGMTPAMAAKVTNRIWEIDDLVGDC